MTTTDQSGQPTSHQTLRGRHVARSARILSTGLSATAILGITAAFGAAERAQSQGNEPATTIPDPGVTSAPPALAPLGAAAPGNASFSAATPTAVVSQFPSPMGTVTLPTGSPTPTLAATVESTPVAVTSPAPQTTPAAVVATPTTALTVDTVAPISPAEPAVELTIPPPPSNGSSGGSR